MFYALCIVMGQSEHSHRITYWDSKNILSHYRLVSYIMRAHPHTHTHARTHPCSLQDVSTSGADRVAKTCTCMRRTRRVRKHAAHAAKTAARAGITVCDGLEVDYS